MIKKQNKALLKNEGLIQVLFDKVDRWDGDWAKTSQWYELGPAFP